MAMRNPRDRASADPESSGLPRSGRTGNSVGNIHSSSTTRLRLDRDDRASPPTAVLWRAARIVNDTGATNHQRSLPALNRRRISRIGLWTVGLSLVLLTGCDYSPPVSTSGTGGTYKPGFIPTAKGLANPGSTAKSSPGRLRTAEERKAILDSSMTLIKGAASSRAAAIMVRRSRSSTSISRGRTRPSIKSIPPPGNTSRPSYRPTFSRISRA